MIRDRRAGLLAGLFALLMAGTAIAASPGAPPYVARGQEPGWHLAIGEQTTTLNTAAGARFEAATPRPRRTATSARYDIAFKGRPVTVTITARLCHDSMSGMPHPDRVTLRGLDGPLKGCGGEPRALLGSGEWKVVRIGAKPALAKAPATLQFLDAGLMAGKASCNRFRTAFKLTGEGLSIEPAATTMMACPPAIMNQEQEFLRQLKATTSFDIRSDGALLLKGPEGATIVAKR